MALVLDIAGVCILFEEIGELGIFVLELGSDMVFFEFLEGREDVGCEGLLGSVSHCVMNINCQVKCI